MHGASVPRYRKEILAPAASICQLLGRPFEAFVLYHIIIGEEYRAY